MKLFSERYKNLESFQLWTYDEVKTVEHGFTESENQNTINILTSRKWGFVEVPVETSVKAIEEVPVGAVAAVEAPVEVTEEVVEAAVAKKRTKKRPAQRKASFTPKEKEKKENSALGMSDVDAFIRRH